MRLSGDLLELVAKAGTAYATGGASLAAEAVSSGGSGGASGGNMAPQGATVSPTLQTAIRQQISPVFIQTGAGSSGDITAGTSMSAGTQQGAPGLPKAAPYSDIGYPSMGAPPDIAPLPTSLIQSGNWQQYLPYALGAIALITVVGMMKKKPRAYRPMATYNR